MKATDFNEQATVRGSVEDLQKFKSLLLLLRSTSAFTPSARAHSLMRGPNPSGVSTRSRVAPIRMQAGAGTARQRQQRTRVAIRERVITKAKDADKEKLDFEENWRVVLHNDDIHTFEFVTDALTKIVQTLSRKKAHRITVTTHNEEMAIVTQTWKQMAKQYCQKLQAMGLTVSISPLPKEEKKD